MEPVRKLSHHLLPKISSDITWIWKREDVYNKGHNLQASIKILPLCKSHWCESWDMNWIKWSLCTRSGDTKWPTILTKSYLSGSPIDVSPEIRIGSNGSSVPDAVMPSGLPCLTKSYLSASPIDVSPEIGIGSNGSSVPDMVIPSGLPCLTKSYLSGSPIDVSPQKRIGSNCSSVPDTVMPSGLPCLSLTSLGVPLMWVLR